MYIKKTNLLFLMTMLATTATLKAQHDDLVLMPKPAELSVGAESALQ
jgi:hypothetical protein